METTRTVVCKLAPTPTQAADLDATLKAFAAASNRKSQAEFRCQACGHEQHADVNAALNIRALAASKTATGLATA